MIKTLLSCLIVTAFCILNIQAQSSDKEYRNLWTQAVQAHNKDLPSTAAQKYGEIFRLAEKNGDFSVQVNAFMKHTEQVSIIHPDSLNTAICQLFSWRKATQDIVQRSILSQALLTLLNEYKSRFQRSFSSSHRVSLFDREEAYTPTNMPKWSAHQLAKERTHLAEEALAPAQQLHQTPITKFTTSRTVKEQKSKTSSDGLFITELVTLNAGSQHFAHDLYHLSCYYVLDLLEGMSIQNVLTYDSLAQHKERILQHMVSFYNAQGNQSGELLVRLDLMDHILKQRQIGTTEYEHTLRQLLVEFSAIEANAETGIRLAKFLQRNGRYTEALQICDSLSKRYRNYDRVNALTETKQDILAPELNLSYPTTVYPGDSIQIIVRYRNLKGFTLSLHSLNLTADAPQLIDIANWQKKELRKYQGQLQKHSFTFTHQQNHTLLGDTFTIAIPKAGIYRITAQTNNSIESIHSEPISVSRLKLLSLALPGNETEARIVDSRTGAPMPNASLKMVNVQENNDTVHVLPANNEGRIRISNNGRFQLFPQTDNDKFARSIGLYQQSIRLANNNTATEHNIQLFTDRSIYRPGQQVYVKGIAYMRQDDSLRVQPGKSCTVQLYDANNKMITEASVTTNEFGSFVHQFTLPQNTLNGHFMVRSEGKVTSFRVEEYKRPSLEVVMDTLRTAPRLLDHIQVTGKAQFLTGIPLQRDTVRYSIVRESRNIWRFYHNTQMELATGTTTTDENGIFQIPVHLLSPGTTGLSGEQFNIVNDIYNFRISVSVTDAAGETYTTDMNVTIGTRSLVLSTNLPQAINRDSSTTYTLSAHNLTGIKVPTSIKLTLFAENSSMAQWSTVAHSEEQLTFPNTLPSGRYRLQLTATDNEGRNCENNRSILLYSATDRKAPVDTLFWVQQLHTEFPIAKPAEILFATSEKDVYLFYDVFSNNKRIESQTLILNDTLLRFQLPYKPEYGDGVNVIFCFVKDGKVHTQAIQIEKPRPILRLQYKWHTFRDRLTPGQHEEWTLTLQNPDGTPAKAELMASLYDAALDKIYPHTNRFLPSLPRFISYRHWQTTYSYTSGFSLLFNRATNNVPAFELDHWSFRKVNPFKGLSVASIDGALQGRIGGIAPSTPTLALQAVSREKAMAEMIATSDATPQSEAQQIHSRSNLRELAFFYPTLRTDSSGNVSISFILPESLTRWHLIGTAHTQNMETVNISEFVTTTKPLMLTPFLPRYLRQGDSTTVTTRLYWDGSTQISGNLVCELFDPSTEKILYRNKQTFQVEAKTTTTYTFQITPPENHSAIGIRFVADGGQYSDGEQHFLSILPERTRLVESIPFVLQRKGTTSIDLSSLFNQGSKSATNKQYTVELCANPQWYAVQALPLLQVPERDDVLSLATAYYAGNVSAWLIKQTPALKNAFQLWAQTGTAPQSELQKNADVVTIPLAETPFLNKADEEQKHRAALIQLLDENTHTYQSNELLRKLQSKQLPDGSFSWFSGMRGSHYITAQVLEIYSRLSKLTETAMPDFLHKSYEYIYQEEATRYANLSKQRKDNYVTDNTAIQYLYLCTLAPTQPTGKAQEARDFYLAHLNVEHKNLSIADKARAVLILSHYKRQASAQEFYNSVKEHSTTTDELGQMFYGNTSRSNIRPLSFSVSSPESVLASVMEAAHLMNDTLTIENIQFALLRLKQTRMWHNNMATANAVHALLGLSPNTVSQQGSCELKIGKQTIRMESTVGSIEAQLGYKKVTFPATTPAPKATFTNKENVPTWGVIYGECEEQISRITTHTTGNSQIEKELFVRNTQSGQTKWEKLTAGHRLQKGDYILTRLTVTTDRDIDFVQIRDNRAACLEPSNQLSGYRNGYYMVSKDEFTDIFHDRLPRGTHVIELQSIVTHTGTYTSGLALFESAYSTDFKAHSATSTIYVK